MGVLAEMNSMQSTSSIGALTVGTLTASQVGSRLGPIFDDLDQSRIVTGLAESKAVSFPQHVHDQTVESATMRTPHSKVLTKFFDELPQQKSHLARQGRLTKEYFEGLEKEGPPQVIAHQVIAEILHYSGRLMRLGSSLHEKKSKPGQRITFLPDDYTRKLIAGGNIMIPGSHPLTLVAVDGLVTLDELCLMLENQEWPLYVPDVEKEKQGDIPIHGTTALPAYFKMWHDLYHWLRHARWSVDNRNLLPQLYRSAEHLNPRKYPFLQEVQHTILDGPDPLLYKKYGFIGAIFFSIGSRALAGFRHTDLARDFSLKFYSQIRRDLRSDDRYDQIVKGFQELTGILQNARDAQISAYNFIP